MMTVIFDSLLSFFFPYFSPVDIHKYLWVYRLSVSYLFSEFVHSTMDGQGDKG